MKKLETDKIWNMTHKSIYVGYEHLQIDTFKDILLKSTDLKLMRQLRNSIDIMQLLQMMKKDLKIDNVFEYKRMKNQIKK